MNKEIKKALIEFSENVEKEINELKRKLEEEQKSCLEKLKDIMREQGE